jgi:nicotinate dehydrogenase subunit A
MPQFDLRINGKTHQVEGAPDDSLLSVLRYELNLTGSKFGCGEGQCGACTVLVDGLAVRSCVTRIGPVAGKAITTIEAIANGDTLHPVQEAFIEADAFQCGYCTSGMVMATIGLLRTTPNPSDAEVARLMDRNVCRCGTYPRIVKAIKLAADKNRQAGVRSATARSATTFAPTSRAPGDGST